MTAPAQGARRRAREAAFRVAFQADVAGDTYAFAWQLRREDEPQLTDDQRELISDVVQLLEERGAEVDGILRECAEHWPLQRLAATDRAVLRISVAEMIARPGTPVRVIIDEAIDISREYGSPESGRFVNGVLDRAARRLRAAEF